MCTEHNLFALCSANTLLEEAAINVGDNCGVHVLCSLCIFLALYYKHTHTHTCTQLESKCFSRIDAQRYVYTHMHTYAQKYTYTQ